MIFSGNISYIFQQIKTEFFRLLTYEIEAQKLLLVNIFLIVILSAVLKQVSQSLSKKSVGEMAFFICYMVLVVILVNTFYDISQMVLDRCNIISKAFLGMLPTFISLSLIGGNVGQGVIVGSTIMSVGGAIIIIINDFILPIILLTMSLEMVDNISEKPMLSKFVELLKTSISTFIKWGAGLFMLVISLEKISGETVNNLATKSAKIAVKSIPIIGDVMGGAVESVTVMGNSLRSGTLVGVIIFLLMLCLPIIIKLFVIDFMFKITSGVSEYIAEERLVDCISSISDYIKMLISIIVLVEGIFLFSALLLLYKI